MGGKHVTEADRLFIRQLADQGFKNSAIAKKVDRSRDSVSKILRRDGFYRRRSDKRKITPIPKEAPPLEAKPKGIVALQDDPENLARVAPEMIKKQEERKEGRGLEALFEPENLGPLARFNEARGKPGVVKLAKPIPSLVPPKQGAREIAIPLSNNEPIKITEGRVSISVSVAPEAVIDLIIAHGGTSPHEVIKWAMCYLRDNEGKIAPPDVVRIIAEATGAPI
jgi:hypothetical protein